MHGISGVGTVFDSKRHSGQSMRETDLHHLNQAPDAKHGERGHQGAEGRRWHLVKQVQL